MAAVRWTRWGAVALPDALQVRFDPLFVDRVKARAPEPARSLTDAELADNLRFFVEPGPRGRPITSLVLSGLPAEAPHDGIARCVAEARRGSVRRVTVHADQPQLDALAGSPLLPHVDALAVAVRGPVAPRVPAGPVVHAVIPLDPATVADLERVVAAAAALSPARVVLTWPFPGGDHAPLPSPAAEVVPRLRAAARALAGLPWSLKGLPGCALGADGLVAGDDVRDLVSRSSNRWYVDADHQRADALLFLPEVVRFAKRESCRFCALDPRCDGVAEPWLAAGLAGALSPIR